MFIQNIFLFYVVYNYIFIRYNCDFLFGILLFFDYFFCNDYLILNQGSYLGFF